MHLYVFYYLALLILKKDEFHFGLAIKKNIFQEDNNKSTGLTNSSIFWI